MARLARIVIPRVPYHVTQRGNRRLPVFFSDGDRLLYLRILREQAQRYQLQIWAYCLMDNHVHLIVVPEEKSSLARGIGETHRRYTRYINHREGWKGYLWQGRFASFPLDEGYLYAAIRYVERNPVRAGLVRNAEEYPWSSARAHVRRIKNDILSDNFLTNEIRDWSAFLKAPEEDRWLENAELHIRTGRPFGPEAFLEKLERITGRELHKRKPGRRKRKGISIVSPE